MNDPQNLGLGELGQRVQAMGDPAEDSRLRPYQGAPQPMASTTNGRSIQALEAYEDVRGNPSAAPPPTPLPYQPFPPVGAAPFSAAAPSSLPKHEPISVWENVALPGYNTAPASAASPQPGNLSSGAPVDPIARNSQDTSNIPHALNAATASAAPKSGIQRAIDAFRSTLPLVQKLLPLLDGNFATALGAMVASQAHHTPPPQVHVDLEPVERGLAEVRNSNRELRAQVQEQGSSLKRVEDQLERVREATDRNTLEQQELVEDLRSVGSRLNTLAILGLVLLAISLGLNIYLMVQMQHILR